MNTGRNLYRKDVDFSQLALQDKEFNKFLRVNGQVNFGDPAAVRQLTLSLLKRDFNLTISLPSDRLCPPVPNRLNYILWLQDLLDQTHPSPSSSFSPTYVSTRQVLGIDIGTGSSAIYPLLGCAQRPAWKFLATDIDETNLEYARQNITQNGLEGRIKVVNRTTEDTLIPIDVLDAAGIDQSVDFVMCNPPFYTGRDEMVESAKAKNRPPFSACTGAEVEMCVPGGEVAFVGRMVEESAREDVKRRVQWFSSMLGKLSSAGEVAGKLKEAGCRNWCVTEFVQGGKTRRWAVAWSWMGWRPEGATARGLGSGALGVLGKAVLPAVGEVVVAVKSEEARTKRDAAVIGREVDELMTELDLRWQWKSDIGIGVGFAKGNVWNRNARRKMKMGSHGDHMDEDGEEPALGFRISLKRKGQDEVEVVIRWIFGFDSVLFESFCGMMKRSLSEAQSK